VALNVREAKLLLDAAQSAGLAHVVTFNYRGNPLVHQARVMIANGQLGDLRFVHGVLFAGLDGRSRSLFLEIGPVKGGYQFGAC